MDHPNIVRLEFSSETSNKFWQINRMTGLAEWGRIGSAPQGRKIYPRLEVNTLIREKTAKGYVVVSRIPAVDKMDEFLESKGHDMGRPNFMSELRKIK